MKIDAVIAKYLEYRGHIDKRNEELNAELKPYGDAMKVMEGFLLNHLNEASVNSIKTEAGTAFTRQTRSSKITDREAFIKFIEAGHWELANIGVSMVDVDQYADEHRGDLPPGIEVSRRIAVVVRRP